VSESGPKSRSANRGVFVKREGCGNGRWGCCSFRIFVWRVGYHLPLWDFSDSSQFWHAFVDQCFRVFRLALASTIFFPAHRVHGAGFLGTSLASFPHFLVFTKTVFLCGLEWAGRRRVSLCSCLSPIYCLCRIRDMFLSKLKVENWRERKQGVHC